MRRLLISTALTCFAFSAMAEVSVKLHGKYEFQGGTRSQKSAYIDQSYLAGTNPFKPGFSNVTSNQKNASFNSNARVGVLVEGKADNGFKYGANVMLNPRTNDSSGYSNNVEKSFLFVEQDLGRVELGSNYGVDVMMNIGADSIACATGGASDGDWSSYFKYDGVDVNGAPKGLSMTPIASGISYLNRSLDNANREAPRKVTYILPSTNGVQLGVSYTPDPNNNGTANNQALIGDFAYAKNIISVAGIYEKQISGLDFALSASYSFSGVNNTSYNNALGVNTGLHKLSDYQIGMKFSKGAFAVAGSYGDAGKSLRAKGLPYKPKQNYYTAGVSYSMDKFAASLTYLGSKNTEEAQLFKGTKYYGGLAAGTGTTGLASTSNASAVPGSLTKLNAYSLGVDYMVASGLKTYAEVTFVSVTNSAIQNSLAGVTYGSPTSVNNPAAPKNNGTVIIAGAVVKF